MNYYYLMASLPMLALGTPPAISLLEFAEFCSQNLTESDLALLSDLLETGGGHSRHPFISEWVRRDGLLRNATVRLRALRFGKDASPYLRQEGDAEIPVENPVAVAYSRGNPLDREIELDRIRWRIIDELAGFDRFSLSAVMAYALQLKLAERWAAMNVERGKQVVEEFVNR